MQCSILKTTTSSFTSKRTILDFVSRRRKRRRSKALVEQPPHNQKNIKSSTQSLTSTSKTTRRTNNSTSFRYQINTWATLLRQTVTQLTNKHSENAIFIIILMSTYSCTNCIASAPCETNHWWAEFKNACLPCSLCPGDMISIRPCQYDHDTKCATTADLNIDVLRLKEDHEMINLEDQFIAQQHLQAEEDLINIVLFVAALACLLLFIVAAFILFYHMRQWRHIEQSLNHDVEELSNRFMAKLAEVQRIDAGAFFIRNTDSLRIPGYQAQYVLLPEKVTEPRQRQQQPQWYVVKSLQPGNVYIEET